MKGGVVTAPPPAPASRFDLRRDGGALLGLAALAAWCLFVSWRRWPDALIDFGRELYTPWRLSQGAMLYRDVDSYYGPLSQHLNGLLFSVFGPGLMVLVAANLVVFAAIVVLGYFLCRRAWGRPAALAAGAVFVAVFGFSQLVGIGNYNFATPYSHETVHGFLVCLGLVAVAGRWVEAPGSRRAGLAGVLWGLTSVLKPEFMLAGGAVLAVAWAWRWRHSGWPGVGPLAAGCAGAVVPFVLFTGYFLTRQVPWGEAASFAGRAWINVLGSQAAGYTGDSIQTFFLGFDRPGSNLLRQGRATALALVGIAAVAALARGLGRLPASRVRTGASIVMGVAIVGIAWRWIEWLEVGRALPGLVALAGAGAVAAGWRRGGGEPRAALRLLLVVLAGALLLRMALNSRVYHYGFYQAALAGVVVTAILVGQVPAWLSAERWTQRAALTAMLLLLGTGAVAIAVNSREMLARKTEPIGQGSDRFLGYPLAVAPTGMLVKLVAEELGRQPATDTLLVLPEGVMINYLARKRSPVAPFIFFSSTTYEGGEERIVRELGAEPPNWVAILSRDLREYGIERYGESAGHGKLLLEWVAANYDVVARAGGDPLDPDQYGVVLLRRK